MVLFNASISVFFEALDIAGWRWVFLLNVPVILLTLCLGAFFTGYLFVISLILQQNPGFTAAKAGLLLFPFSLLSAVVGKFVIPPLLRRVSLVQAAIVGIAAMALGTLAL